jgi:hypothetical protein
MAIETNVSKSGFPFIPYPQVNEMIKEMDRCREQSKITREPQCMTIEGCAGAGKSEIAKMYCDMHPVYETETGIKMPVFYFELPAPATPKAMLEALLRQLGDPGASKGTAPTLMSRAVGLILSCGIEHILIDEFSNLYHKEKHMIMSDASDCLKMIIKQTNVPVVVIGVDDKVSMILSENRQFSRLFAFRGKIKPFEWTDTKHVQEFGMFIQAIENQFGMKLSAETSRDEVCYRISYATDGIMCNIMNLMWLAKYFANENTHSAIQLSDLNISFERRIAPDYPYKTNPFIYSADDTFIAPSVVSAKIPDACSYFTPELSTR